MKRLQQYIIEAVSEVNGFCILKPEFLGHEEDFIKMLENNGWNIIRKEKKTISLDMAKELYNMHKDKKFFGDLCRYMSSGDALYCMCHKDCSDPIKDMNDLKDKVRANWGKDKMRNAMHSSDSIENVEREYKIVF